MGYELARAILQHKHSFLLRMSSKVRLYAHALNETPIEQWQEGLVYYWPETVQKKQQPPLCRLIRVQAKGQTKRDVWLFTNILDQQRLSAKRAANSIAGDGVTKASSEPTSGRSRKSHLSAAQ